MLLWALLASGQIQMRMVDGWEALSQPIKPMPLDLAARKPLRPFTRSAQTARDGCLQSDSAYGVKGALQYMFDEGGYIRMTYKEILRLPARHIRQYRLVFAIGFIAVALIAIYPSDIQSYRENPYTGADMPAVVFVEDNLRHVNTLAALAVPLVMRDWVGLKQLSAVTVAGIIATHGPKRLLDRVTIGGTRLGERPSHPQSRHNMPSGHSALASGVIWFLGRRYGWGWLALTVPITLATMGTRVLLNAHTINSVLVGALVGLLVAALFVTRRRS